MKIQNKKGLSDVVSTVLIIMVVIIAIVAIYTLFVQPFLTEGGEKINTATLCIENSVTPITCKLDIPTDSFKAGIRTTAQEGVTLSSATDATQLTEFYPDGQTFSLGINPPANGAVGTIDGDSDVVGVGPSQIQVTATFIVGGSEYKCTSAKIACS